MSKPSADPPMQAKKAAFPSALMLTGSKSRIKQLKVTIMARKSSFRARHAARLDDLAMSGRVPSGDFGGKRTKVEQTSVEHGYGSGAWKGAEERQTQGVSFVLCARDPATNSPVMGALTPAGSRLAQPPCLLSAPFAAEVGALDPSRELPRVEPPLTGSLFS